MKLALLEPPAQRKKILLAGNVALTNVTVADVIYNHGGGIPHDACPADPAGCWCSWWRKNEPTFHVKDIKQSRKYVNYPNYGIYHDVA